MSPLMVKKVKNVFFIVQQQNIIKITEHRTIENENWFVQITYECVTMYDNVQSKVSRL